MWDGSPWYLFILNLLSSKFEICNLVNAMTSEVLSNLHGEQVGIGKQHNKRVLVVTKKPKKNVFDHLRS